MLLLFSIAYLDTVAIFCCLPGYCCCFLLPVLILLLFSIAYLDTVAVFYFLS